MTELEVTCVVRRGNTHESISHLGGPAGGGWRWPTQQVIAAIRAGTHTFYTLLDSRRAELHVAGETSRYVRTMVDGKWTNQLLRLQGCSVKLVARSRSRLLA